MEYKILSDLDKGDDFSVIEQEVNDYLANGWELHGDLKITPIVIDEFSDGAGEKINIILYTQVIVK